MATVNKIYIGVGGKAKTIVRAYVGDDSNIARLFFEDSEAIAARAANFELGTDEDIQTMLTNHYNGKIDIADYWSVGDIRQASDTNTLFQVAAHTSLRTYASSDHGTTSLSWQTTYSMPKQTTIKWQIIGIKHDNLTSNINTYNKAAITIQTVGLLGNTANDTGNYRVWMSMNDSNTNVNSWKGCQMRKYLTGWASNTNLASDGSGNFYNACNFKSLIKKVNKSTNTGNASTSNTSLEITNDYIFLLSEWEVFGATTHSVGNENCTQYAYYSQHNTATDRVKRLGWEGASGGAYSWWERSPRSGFSSRFCFVDSDGSAYRDYASINNGVAPAACL